MQVNVRIRGNDAQGKAFEEDAGTLAINAHGALIGMKARLTSGSLVHMQHGLTKQEQECQVVFLGPVRDGKGEIGLEFSPLSRLCGRGVLIAASSERCRKVRSRRASTARRALAP